MGSHQAMTERNTIRSLTVLDLFCGAGGLSAGFRRDARFRIVAAVEASRHAAEAYRLNHPGVKVYEEDVKGFNAAKVERDLGISSVNIMIGGPPCQAYSIAGKRSRHDPRGQLVEEYVRLLAEFKPGLFLCENVPGLLAVDERRFFRHLCARFELAGYRLRYRLLNAADYGVPQVRKRLFVVGTRLGHAFRFPAPTHSGHGAGGLQAHVTIGDAIGDLPLVESGEKAGHYATAPQNEYQTRMRERSHGLTDHDAPRHAERLLALMAAIPDGGSARDLPELPDWFKKIRSFTDTYSRLRWDTPCTTLTTHFGTPSSSRCIHPRATRALTTREAARIQSFPDDFIFVGPRASRNLQVGNAVPPLLAGALASTIAEHFRLGPPWARTSDGEIAANTEVLT